MRVSDQRKVSRAIERGFHSVQKETVQRRTKKIKDDIGCLLTCRGTSIRPHGTAFFAAVRQAQELAQLRLKTAPEDTNALFAIALSLGMEADYASLIDKHQIESLKKIRQAETYAKKLLKIEPNAADAYLGLGTANYFIGSQPIVKKFFLGFIGIHGNKEAGIQQIQIAADRGHYLRPFAKILLALAACARNKQKWLARNSRNWLQSFPQIHFS